MDKEIRNYLQEEVSRRSRERADRGYMDCDPETLTRKACEAEELGETFVANAIRKFRDRVVNPLLGEGWTLDRIEVAALNYFKSKPKSQ